MGRVEERGVGGGGERGRWRRRREGQVEEEKGPFWREEGRRSGG